MTCERRHVKTPASSSSSPHIYQPNLLAARSKPHSVVPLPQNTPTLAHITSILGEKTRYRLRNIFTTIRPCPDQEAFFIVALVHIMHSRVFFAACKNLQLSNLSTDDPPPPNHGFRHIRYQHLNFRQKKNGTLWYVMTFAKARADLIFRKKKTSLTCGSPLRVVNRVHVVLFSFPTF